MTPADLLLALNTGSSGIKFAIYEANRPSSRRIARSLVDLQRQSLTLSIAEGPQPREIRLKANLEYNRHRKPQARDSYA